MKKILFIVYSLLYINSSLFGAIINLTSTPATYSQSGESGYYSGLSLTAQCNKRASDTMASLHSQYDPTYPATSTKHFDWLTYNVTYCAGNGPGFYVSYVIYGTIPCVPITVPPAPYEKLGSYPDLSACQASFNTGFYTYENKTCYVNNCDSSAQVDLYATPKPLTCHNLPADVDEDDDCDGIPDIQDPNHPDYGTCIGDSHVVNNRWGRIYNTSQYVFKANMLDDYCGDFVYNFTNPDTGSSSGLTYCDSAYDTRDLNPVCIRKYCYIHDYTAPPLPDTCARYSPTDNQPSGYIYTAVPDTEAECIAKVDNTRYSSHIWDVPDSSNCPNVHFCFLKLLNAPPPTPSDNPTVDSNSTTADNRAIVDAQNITNTHLTDIKDEAIKTNEKLTDIIGVSNQILTSTKEVNDNLRNVIAKSEIANASLTAIDNSIKSGNDNAKTTGDTLAAKLDTVSTNLDQLEVGIGSVVDKLDGGLFGDDPFLNTDLTDDGSSTFSSLQTQASDSFSLLNYDNIFGFAHSTGVTLPTYSVNLHGTTVTIFTPSMLDGFPIAEMRSLIMFIFALLGFITIFRTV
ncbi:hypothetical protein KKG77_04455 [bacterium]|nr:hypothetical protein [bacterium]